jgi:hypothetical protein
VKTSKLSATLTSSAADLQRLARDFKLMADQISSLDDLFHRWDALNAEVEAFQEALDRELENSAVRSKSRAAMTSSAIWMKNLDYRRKKLKDKIRALPTVNDPKAGGKTLGPLRFYTQGLCKRSIKDLSQAIELCGKLKVYQIECFNIVRLMGGSGPHV